MTDNILERLGARFNVDALEKDTASIAVVDEDGLVVWVNASWRAFGAENGADPKTIESGVNYSGSVAGDLQGWIDRIRKHCAETGEVFSAEYECSSPTRKRYFHMRVLPIPSVGLMFVHALSFEGHHTEVPAEPDVARYASNAGFIVACSNCRHVRRNDSETWDWIPAWIAKPPASVSHGLCALCLDYYYWPDR